MLEIMLAILAGVVLGIITGLTPGIHVNLVAMLLISAGVMLDGIISPIAIAVAIISTAVTHTFLDSIPSVFLGAPDADTCLNVLPGHRLLMQGKGYEAVKLTIIGSLLCLIGVIVIIPLMIPILPFVYGLIEGAIGWILLFVVLFMIFRAKGWEMKLWSFILFIMSGALGVVVLGFPNLSNPLFPLLSGLFGVSTLLMSLKDDTKVPKQSFKETIFVPKWETFKALGAGVFSGSLTGMLPGLGSAQAAIIGQNLVRKISEHGFMILVGGINTANFVFSIAAIYAIEKARNGAIIAVNEVMGNIGLPEVVVFCSAALISGGIATWLAFRITRIFARIMERVNYKAVCISIITLITVMSVWFSGAAGLLVLATSTAVGMIAPIKGVGRNMAMGCLMLPVICFFLL